MKILRNMECARGSRAFTLIELLVVIAIIALLVGFALPALSKARRSSRQTVTLVRLHDLGAGMTAYANDFRDRLPVLVDREEKPFLGLSVLSRYNAVTPASFLNPNVLDTLSPRLSVDQRPVLATLDEVAIENATRIDASNIAGVRFHCSFSFDNDIKLHTVYKPVIYLGDRADYAHGRTLSSAWGGEGMCVAWTDQHAAFVRQRSVAAQNDPNMYHHNEWMGEGSDEVRDGVGVTQGTLDTHMRFFSEEEDDELLTDPEP